MNFAIIAQQLVSGMGSSLMIFVLTLLFSMPLGASGCLRAYVKNKAPTGSH